MRFCSLQPTLVHRFQSRFYYLEVHELGYNAKLVLMNNVLSLIPNFHTLIKKHVFEFKTMKKFISLGRSFETNVARAVFNFKLLTKNKILQDSEEQMLSKLKLNIFNMKLSKNDVCSQRGVLQMRISTLFGAKNVGFFEIYGVRTYKGEGVCADIFRTRGRGRFFAILCGRLLWTAPDISLLVF